MATRAIVTQHRTQCPVQFEIAPATRDAVQASIKQAGLETEDIRFPSRLHESPHVGTRQYAPKLGHWFGPRRLRQNIYALREGSAYLPRTRNLCAEQVLLGHSRLESTVRFLGIEVDDAL